MIEIRPAQPDDAQLIVDFQLKMADETEGLKLNRETVSKGVLAVLQDKTKGQYYIAEQTGCTLGMLLTIPEWSDWRNGTVVWIHSLYIRPEHRRKGAYKKMYQYLKTKMQNSPDIVGLRLYVDSSNTTARRVYEQLGMHTGHYLLYEYMK
jgi:ribosomal protein S18 acetylase RimI-like enzyme